jgi:hypothetical protein
LALGGEAGGRLFRELGVLGSPDMVPARLTAMVVVLLRERPLKAPSTQRAGRMLGFG